MTATLTYGQLTKEDRKLICSVMENRHFNAIGSDYFFSDDGQASTEYLTDGQRKTILRWVLKYGPEAWQNLHYGTRVINVEGTRYHIPDGNLYGKLANCDLFGMMYADGECGT